MSKTELHRWLFSHMEGREIRFYQQGMPYKVMSKKGRFGGKVDIGDCRCRIRIIHKEEAEKGKKYEVRFPDTELEQKVEDEKTTLVGYIEFYGNWREGEGHSIFHVYHGEDEISEKKETSERVKMNYQMELGI